MESELELSQLQQHLLHKEYDELSTLCKDMLHNSPDGKRLCLVYYYSALAHIKKDMYQQAIDDLFVCAERLQQQPNSYKLIRAFVELEIATCYNNTNDVTLALPYAEKSLGLFTELGDNNGKSRSYLVLGTAYILLREIQQSLEYLQKGLEFATENSKDTRVRILINMSGCYTLTSQEEEVLSCSKQALDILDECDEINSSEERIQQEGALQRTPLGYVRSPYALTHLKSQCYGNITTVLSNHGLFETATEYMNKGIELALATGNHVLIVHWKHTVSNTLLEFSMTKDARIHLRDAQFYLQKEVDNTYPALIEFNLGRCCFLEADYKQALSHFETSKSITDSLNLYHSSASICNYFAKSYRLLGNMKLAKQYLQEGFVNVSKLEDDYMRIMLQLEEANHLILANNKQAIPILQSVLKQCRTLKNKTEEIEALEKLAEACSMFNQHKQSIEYYQELMVLQKQTFTNRSHQQISSLSVLHRTETLQLEKKLLEEREQTLYIERDHLQTQLTMKTNAMLEQLKAVNQLRTEVLDTLRDIDSAESILIKVKKKLNASSVLRQDWNSFAEVFDQVHPSFVKNLTKQYPLLTKMEVRICILLRTGMTTDDMAQLLSLSDRSIESHRLHLRKKLYLQRNDTLYTVLSTL